MKALARTAVFAFAIASFVTLGSCKDKNENEMDGDTTTTTTTNDMDGELRESPMDTVVTDNDTVVKTGGADEPNVNPVGEQEP